jgi:hypothetical protein
LPAEGIAGIQVETDAVDGVNHAFFGFELNCEILDGEQHFSGLGSYRSVVTARNPSSCLQARTLHR